jgi:hypothetical protein
MQNAYVVLGFGSLVPILWYQKRRIDELGRPTLGSLGWNGLVRYVFAAALWPWPIGVLIAIAYYRRQGNAARVNRLHARFDEICGLTRRINAVNHWSLGDLEGPHGDQTDR